MDTISALSTGTYSTNEVLGSSEVQSGEELYNTWITLLAAELEHQDPTDPVDTTEYTSQLMSLSQIEQQSLTNDTLATILDMAQSIENDSASSYLGATVTAEGDTSPLSGGTAEWSYALDAEASDVSIEISDLNGDLVYSTNKQNVRAGDYDFTWDGATNSGSVASDGAYVLSVSAVGVGGQAVNASTSVRGTVTGVETSGAGATLLLDNVAVPKSTVTATQL